MEEDDRLDHVEARGVALKALVFLDLAVVLGARARSATGRRHHQRTRVAAGAEVLAGVEAEDRDSRGAGPLPVTGRAMRLAASSITGARRVRDLLGCAACPPIAHRGGQERRSAFAR